MMQLLCGGCMLLLKQLQHSLHHLPLNLLHASCYFHTLTHLHCISCLLVCIPAAELDAYVLSESSLFVYPTKWVLKTCGTTKLLRAVPRLLEMAAELNMLPRRCKYSRASFLFPEQQVGMTS
jgi:hypothetical protein